MLLFTPVMSPSCKKHRSLMASQALIEHHRWGLDFSSHQVNVGYMQRRDFSFILLCKSTPECADVYIFMRYFQPRLSEEQIKRRAAFLAVFQWSFRAPRRARAPIVPPGCVPISTGRFVNSK